jgi:hypothetical protein
MKRRLGYGSVWAMALLLAPTAACADSVEIEHQCTMKYPGLTQHFAWKDCIKTETQRNVDADLLRQTEDLIRGKKEAAQPCTTADIPRMEALAEKVKAAVRNDSSLEEVKSALALIIGPQGGIQIAKDGTKERLFVTSIATQCDASFRFFINVREGPDKQLRWVRVWAQDAPTGYPDDLHLEFSSDFDAQRQEFRRAEEAKHEEDIRARFAKEAREREEQRQRFLQGVKISNVKMKCATGDSCATRTLEFVVTNVSPQPIKDISFGFLFLPLQTKECPAKLTTNESGLEAVLQPGAKASQTIHVSNGPENRDAKYCLRVTDFRTVNPWER